MLPLGIISDEVHDDLEKSCEFIKKHGLEWVELRSLWGTNLLELSEEQVQKAKSILDKYDFKVAAVASPVFKSPLGGRIKSVKGDFLPKGHQSPEEQLQLLEHAASLCRIFQTRVIRIFTFLREDWSEQVVKQIVQHLLKAAKIARDHDIMLVVENEPICNVRHGREMGVLFDALEANADSALLNHLAVLWDPGNAYYAGEIDAYPAGYEAVRGRVRHLHIKDVYFDSEGYPHCVPVGQGRVDYINQISALISDGYQGPLILEPHYAPEGGTKMEGSQEAINAMKKLLKSLPI